jgi:hypothetical protein
MFVWYGLAIVTKEVPQQSEKLVEKLRVWQLCVKLPLVRSPRPDSDAVMLSSVTEDRFVDR